MKSKSIAVVLFVAFVSASCMPASTLVPTEIIVTTPLSKLTITPYTPPNKPAPNITATTTLAAKLERWQEYENALAAKFLPLPYIPGKGLCEWEILGQSEHEVYVWAICQVAGSIEGTAMSAPAVIYLAENGSIENVKVPGDGSQYANDISNMFPKDLQQKILSFNSDEMWSHLQLRQTNPEPPLIVGTGVPLP